MKKLTLVMLVAIVPFLTMAQKRAKKGKVKATEDISAAYEFMVIKGYAVNPPVPDDMADELEGPNAAEIQAKMMQAAKIMVVFDFGGIWNEERIILAENRYKSMAHAVNSAAKYNWEFISASSVNTERAIVHYYYMKRKK